jgi:uncharacterized repeat protein (TIGR03803 family)
MTTRHVSSTAGLILCTLGLNVCVNAQDATSATHPKELILHRLINPLHAAYGPASAVHEPSRVQPAAAAPGPHEIVLHHFATPLYGQHPNNGVIRDIEGNLYGTTNGSFSDIGGGGPEDAGVVFKVNASGQETVLYSFTGGADGSSPNGVIRDSAGNLYGTTGAGGAANSGVVFKLYPSGHETVLYSFTGGNDGGSPNSVVRDSQGNLYGATNAGGSAGYGVIFKIDVAGHESTLYTFTGGADGADPNPYGILDSQGNYYGTASYGGNQSGYSGSGVVFKIDPSGHETVLYTFTGENDGAYPNGVIRDSQGNVYATTTGGGAFGAGVVFKLDSKGHQTLLYTFTGGDDGGGSDASLTRDAAGNLYGTTNGGGASNDGVVFKVDPSDQETVLLTFERGALGAYPVESGVILDPAGNLYGTAAFQGTGGQGLVYKLDRARNATVVYAFPGKQGGEYPYNAGVTVGADGHLYGATFYGGHSGQGVVYKLGDNDDEQVLYVFSCFTPQGFCQTAGGVVQDAAGNWYGTTFSGQSATGQKNGLVYRLDRAGHATVLHNFTGGDDGANPYDGVILGPKGTLYGTAVGGGTANNGVVFEIDASGNEHVLYNFSGGNDGGGPLGGLVRDAAGNLYGTTSGGGTSGAGVVFKVEPNGHESVLYSFTGGADGNSPIAGLLRDSEGNLYGTTSAGGTANQGTVFKVNPSGHETVLYSFTGGSDGDSPLWSTLVRDSAGNLYGTTPGGGAFGQGVVFKVDPSGHETVLYSFTGGNDGASPFAGVVFGPGGNLFGTTAFGGESDVGVVFEIVP